MADSSVAPPPASTGTETATPKKSIPKGIVLGKDGKPCRSCTSFASWAANTKGQTSKSSSSTATAAGLGALAGANTTAISPQRDCPPDVEELGRSSWTLLHSIAAQYPISPTATEKATVTNFMGLFSKVYPCWVCAEDFQEWIGRNGVKAGSRDEFGRWLCEGHNEVNRKLGKTEFDCSKWEERWRSGWKDGRCD